ncbi:MAG: hypothetical protein F6J93_28540 [Oscillatoria sp. SIO1A7]|nr:hypothetical protein [Oscillatoria sp. SIO1A7]
MKIQKSASGLNLYTVGLVLLAIASSLLSASPTTSTKQANFWTFPANAAEPSGKDATVVGTNQLERPAIPEQNYNAHKQLSKQVNTEYAIKELEQLYIVGFSLETSLTGDRYITDLENIWARYAEQYPLSKITNKLDDKIYVVYTNYGSGDDGYGFTIVLGHRVANLDAVPADLDSITVPTSKYAVFNVSGKEQNVSQMWEHIEGNAGLERAYSADLEIYDGSSIDETQGNAEIWASVE